MSSTTVIIFGALFILLNGFLLWFFLGKKAKEKGDDDTGLKLILEQMNELTRRQSELTQTVDTKLLENSRQMTESLHRTSETSAKIIRDVTEKLTRLDETNRQVVSFADQLQSLQDILKNTPLPFLNLVEGFQPVLSLNILIRKLSKMLWEIDPNSSFFFNAYKIV